jgi:hypothetical protein
VPVLRFRTVGQLSTFSEDLRLCTKPEICKSSGTIRRKLIRRKSFRASVLRPTLQLRGAKTIAGEFCALTTNIVQSLSIVDQYVVDRLTFRILTLGRYRHDFAVF